MPPRPLWCLATLETVGRRNTTWRSNSYENFGSGLSGVSSCWGTTSMTYGEPAHFDAALGQPYGFFQEQQIPVYAVLGNHDVQTARGVLQLQYWGGLPRYYQFTMAQGAVAILALDTTLLLPGTYDCYTAPAAHAWAQRLAAHQLTWLAHALRTSGASLKIVVGHYPLYSSGPHGLETDHPGAPAAAVGAVAHGGGAWRAGLSRRA